MTTMQHKTKQNFTVCLSRSWKKALVRFNQTPSTYRIGFILALLLLFGLIFAAVDLTPDLSHMRVTVFDLDWLWQDLPIWTPDLIGSICFLVSSGLALLEFCHGHWCWRLHDISWWIVIVNLLGSIAFMISAVFAVVLPGSVNLDALWIVNLSTCIGAMCFLVGAYLLLPERARAVPSD